MHDDAQLWMTIAYIARNPVASGLCRRADEWEWGSHAAIVAGNGRPAWLDVRRLLAFLRGLVGGSGRDAYQRCVDGESSLG